MVVIAGGDEAAWQIARLEKADGLVAELPEMPMKKRSPSSALFSDCQKMSCIDACWSEINKTGGRSSGLRRCLSGSNITASQPGNCCNPTSEAELAEESPGSTDRVPGNTWGA